MNASYVAPIVISACIDYFDKKKSGTTYHPEKNLFIIDAKIAARIVKYNGQLNAGITGAEKKFFGDILRYVDRLGLRLFESTTTGHTFIVSKHEAFPRFALKFERKTILPRIGRKPKFIEEPKWQTQVMD